MVEINILAIIDKREFIDPLYYALSSDGLRKGGYVARGAKVDDVKQQKSNYYNDMRYLTGASMTASDIDTYWEMSHRSYDAPNRVKSIVDTFTGRVSDNNWTERLNAPIVISGGALDTVDKIVTLLDAIDASQYISYLEVLNSGYGHALPVLVRLVAELCQAELLPAGVGGQLRDVDLTAITLIQDQGFGFSVERDVTHGGRTENPFALWCKKGKIIF